MLQENIELMIPFESLVDCIEKLSIEDKFRLWMLIGEPRIEKLRPTYGKALNILNKMPVKKDFVTEREVTKFSRELGQEMANHPVSG